MKPTRIVSRLIIAAVGGALSLLGPGNHIEIPAETLVEVSLKQAVSF